MAAAGFPFEELLEELRPVVLRNASPSTAACLGLASRTLFREFLALNISWKDVKVSICEDGMWEKYEWAKRELRMVFGSKEIKVAAKLGHSRIVLDAVKGFADVPKRESKTEVLFIVSAAASAGQFHVRLHLPPPLFSN